MTFSTRTFRLVGDTDLLATLEFQPGQDSHSQIIPIQDREEVRIGRDEKCTFSLLDDHVSKTHFRIYSVIFDRENRFDVPAMVFCEDLESINGTYVNNRLIGISGKEKVPHLLCDGDVIRIMPKWTFHFKQRSQNFVQRSEAQEEDMKFFAGQYTVSHRILGSGQYGEVFLAEEKSANVQLACKVVSITASDDSEIVESPYFNQKMIRSHSRRRQNRSKAVKEVEILSKLTHPNVIDIKRAFVSGIKLYIFTDLAAGGDLFSFLDSHGGQLDDIHARVVSRQIVLGLEYIHSKGVAHRDIKPENVLVTRMDFGCRVVLTDFGHASIIKPGARMLSRVGTPCYAAPEVDAVEKSKTAYTMAADMWSLGMTTICILTGETLIPRGKMTQLNQIKIAENLVHVEDSQLAQRWLSISPRAYDYLKALLKLEPGQRLNAIEARHHAWFKEPRNEAENIEAAYDRINKTWKAREMSADVIVNLPSERTSLRSKLAESTVQHPRRKLPDATMLPHFSLDRHINPRIPSTRKEVIALVEASQSKFVNSANNGQRKTSQRPITSRLSSRSNSKTMAGAVAEGAPQDLLGTSNRELPIDSIILNPNRVKIMRPKPNVHTQPGDLIWRDDSSGFHRTLVNAREESLECVERLENPTRPETDLQTRRLHDQAAREVPRYCTAKVLGDKVAALKRLQ